MLLTCVYTYTEKAWVNFYKISSAKASGYYFTDGWKNQEFSLCKDFRQFPKEQYSIISLIYTCSHLDSHILCNFDSHFLSPILHFEN